MKVIATESRHVGDRNDYDSRRAAAASRVAALRVNVTIIVLGGKDHSFIFEAYSRNLHQVSEQLERRGGRGAGGLATLHRCAKLKRLFNT